MTKIETVGGALRRDGEPIQLLAWPEIPELREAMNTVLRLRDDEVPTMLITSAVVRVEC